MDIYELARGPLAWISFVIFFLGSFYRIAFLLYSGKPEPVTGKSRRIKDAARSILYGIIPFSSTIMRKWPFFTVATFIFHICVILLPIFLLAHTVLWYESWGIQWSSLPDTMADIMTIWVILACLYFVIRRTTLGDVKKVSRPIDLLFPAIILVTFLTGFLASQQWGPYRPVLIMHIVTSELLLAILPFSKLGHMLFFWFSRAYMGTEFGKHLNARDW
jgi:nitrate reductase gamma subunit